MADPWLKMRGALLDHPKVITMARKLQDEKDFREWLTPSGSGVMNGQSVSDHALRCVTVGALLKFWSVARAHGVFEGNDLCLRHSMICDIDNMSGVPGMAYAMTVVGWAVEMHGEGQAGIKLPNFKEYNVPPTPAEKQSAFRKRQREGTREKRAPRPSKEKPTPVVYPDWLPLPEWLKFVQARKQMHKPMTEHAKELTIKDLAKYREQGHDPKHLLELAIKRGWQGIYLENGKNGQPRHPEPTREEMDAALAHEREMRRP